MPSPRIRTYSRHSHILASILGQMIQLARKKRRLSEQALAERTGMSRATLRRIESGDMKCEVGLVLELTTLLQIPVLATNNAADLETMQKHLTDSLTLSPKRIRAAAEPPLYDDF